MSAVQAIAWNETEWTSPEEHAEQFLVRHELDYLSREEKAVTMHMITQAQKGHPIARVFYAVMCHLIDAPEESGLSVEQVQAMIMQLPLSEGYKAEMFALLES